MILRVRYKGLRIPIIASPPDLMRIELSTSMCCDESGNRNRAHKQRFASPAHRDLCGKAVAVFSRIMTVPLRKSITAMNTQKQKLF